MRVISTLGIAVVLLFLASGGASAKTCADADRVCRTNPYKLSLLSGKNCAASLKECQAACKANPNAGYHPSPYTGLHNAISCKPGP